MAWYWIVLIGIAWWGCGVAGFVFWWTTEYDVTFEDLLIGILWGILGILSWVVGYFIIVEPFEEKTIFKKRR